MNIHITYLEIDKRLELRKDLRKLIVELAKEEGKSLGEINFIFTSNKKILEINKNFLNHSYYTDVITFVNNKRNTLFGDVYISIEQVLLNARQYKVLFEDEIQRVIIHGVLHLIGYNDISKEEKIIMRDLEDKYLCRFKKYT